MKCSIIQFSNHCINLFQIFPNSGYFNFWLNFTRSNTRMRVNSRYHKRIYIYIIPLIKRHSRIAQHD